MPLRAFDPKGLEAWEGCPDGSVAPVGGCRITPTKGPMVCCRVVDDWRAQILGARHCVLVDENGNAYELFPVGGVGVPQPPNPGRGQLGFDPAYRCGSCKPKTCNTGDCFKEASSSYPVGAYDFSGPNSNTFASSVFGKCCEGPKPDNLGFTPGWGAPPPAPAGQK